MNAAGLILAYLAIGTAVMIAMRVGTRGRLDLMGSGALGILWPATFMLLLLGLLCALLSRWARGMVEVLDDSPPVCNECGLFAADVTIAGVRQARCSCSDGCPAAPPTPLSIHEAELMRQMQNNPGACCSRPSIKNRGQS